MNKLTELIINLVKDNYSIEMRPRDTTNMHIIIGKYVGTDVRSSIVYRQEVLVDTEVLQIAKYPDDLLVKQIIQLKHALDNNIKS